MWIVVAFDPARIAGACDTATEALLAASAASATTSVPTATAATSTARKPVLMRLSFRFIVSGGLERAAEHVPIAVLVPHEIGAADRKVVRRRRCDRQARQEEWGRLAQVSRRAQQAGARRIPAGALQRVDHPARRHRPVATRDRSG